MRSIARFAIAALIAVVACRLHADDDAKSVLVKVVTRSAKSYVGELVEKEKGAVTLVDLVTNRTRTIAAKDVLKVVDPATLEEATSTVGLPAVIAWQLGKLTNDETPVGKVAKVTAQVVYLTLGSTKGIAVGDKLTAYRRKGEIKDPDSGEVLAFERPKLCELKVIEVRENFSKAKIESEFEVSLQAGDEVEPSEKSALRVAVSPFILEDGPLTTSGAKIVRSKLTEELTTTLVKRGISVVERSLLDKVLAELIAQQSELFNTQGAQQLGKLAGATVVVTGRVIPDEVRVRSKATDSNRSIVAKRFATVHLRAIDVETAEILFALSERRQTAEWGLVAIGTPLGIWRTNFPEGTVGFRDHHYWKSTTGMKWEEAKKACEQLGGHLVYISDAEEQAFLVELTRPFRPKVNVWIGLQRSGKEFRWLSGDHFRYSAWATLRDERIAQTRDHFIMGRNHAGKWQATPNDTHHLVCEWDY